MKATIQGPLPDNPRNLMRRLGYGEAPGFKGQISYERRVHGSKFPRFHAYLDNSGGEMTVNLHLDHNEGTHKGMKAHGAEYDGKLVEEELARIERGIHALKVHNRQQRQAPPSAQQKRKGGFFGKFFS